MNLVKSLFGKLSSHNGRLLFKIIFLSACLALTSCVGAQNGEQAQRAAAQGNGSEEKYEKFNYNNFSNPIQIDNEWLPLKPGTRLVFEGTTVDDEGQPLPHKVIINVTDLTKVIDGVQSVVAYDLDYSDGELVEAELAFFAQDNDGNVWRMGEHPEEYEDGEFVIAPTWLAGIENAKAGISMKGSPETGTPSYSQGWAPSVGFTDRGQVEKFEEEVCVPVKCYQNVLVIAEGSEEEVDAQQLKYFARGVGNIYVGWRGEGEKTQEVLELTEIHNLDAAAMDQLRNDALALEKHAYEISKDVYGKTPPVERRK